MRGSRTPVDCRPSLRLWSIHYEIIREVAQSNGATLNRHRQRCPLSDYLAEESGTGGPRQLDGEILADQREVAGDHHRPEIAGAGLEKSAAPSGFLDQNFTALTEQ